MGVKLENLNFKKIFLCIRCLLYNEQNLYRLKEVKITLLQFNLVQNTGMNYY